MSGGRVEDETIMMKTLSFSEIVRGRDASVRVTEDGYLYAIELTQVMTGADAKYASQVILIENLIRDFCRLGKTHVILRIPDTVFDSSKFIERQLSKHGGPKTKLVSLRDAMQLVMVLPGKVAKETRAQFAGVIERYIAGDRSLHAEIEANAGSGSGLARLARESLGLQQEREDDAVVSIGMKRKREELELLRMEHEITSLMIDNKAKEQARILAASAELERLRDPTRSNLDERTRLMIQDSLQNSLLLSMSGSQQQQLLIAAGPSPSAPISISSVAAKLGYKGTSVDFQRVGMDVRKRYVAKHGKPPSKHEQLCDGRVTAVNSYTEADRGLVETALRRYFRPSTTGGSESSGSE